jgi:hypothetical protein
LNQKALLKSDYIKIYAEIEFNATEDTLFERMTLTRLQEYSDTHFGTTLDKDVLSECAELNLWLSSGKSEKAWKQKIRKKRLSMIEAEQTKEVEK